MTNVYYSKLDSEILDFLANKNGHPTDSYRLLRIAAALTGGDPLRLIGRRMQVLRKVGRIRYVGVGESKNPSGRTHGWIVLPSEEVE